MNQCVMLATFWQDHWLDVVSAAGALVATAASVIALIQSGAANKRAEEANTISARSNTIAEEANGIAREALKEQREAGQLQLAVTLRVWNRPGAGPFLMADIRNFGQIPARVSSAELRLTGSDEGYRRFKLEGDWTDWGPAGMARGLPATVEPGTTASLMFFMEQSVTGGLIPLSTGPNSEVLGRAERVVVTANHQTFESADNAVLAALRKRE